MASSDKPAAVVAVEPTMAVSTGPEALEVIESPTSPSSGLALSRFEFETGKGNEGTKILMVEWDDSVGGMVEMDREQARATAGRKEPAGDWDISWPGKTAVLQIGDAEPDSANIRRVYYLLPPGAHVPPLITIARQGGNRGAGACASGPTVLRTKPMPAIFPAELGGAEVAGRRGVLHTIWSKKRLAGLQDEIAAEMKANGESVGLEMAMQERQWIADHFGLAPEQDQQGVPKPALLDIPQIPLSPTSPRSPIAGRLGEKLRGLKLATSPAELAAATQGMDKCEQTLPSPDQI